MTDKSPSSIDRAAITKTRLASAVTALLATREGREYVWWLLSISQIGGQPFTPNALQTAFNCGSLNIGNQILSHLLEVAPEGYLQMQKEQASDDRTYTDLASRDAGEPVPNSSANADTDASYN